jgi:hypothetical protein
MPGGRKTTTAIPNKKEAVRVVIIIEQRNITQQTIPKAPLVRHIRVLLSSILPTRINTPFPFPFSSIILPNHDSFAF